MPPPPQDPDAQAEPADWQTVKRILADALELPAEERGAAVRAACGGDAALEAQVLELLPEPESEEHFLQGSAPRFTLAGTPQAGDRLGNYRLERLLGEGGMGQVYQATQENPQRTVAIKIMRPGLLTESAARRFEWESELLARLSHDTIARVLEAGTALLANGQPISWFAMEQVEGQPLLRAADQLGLDRRARLRLFVRICEGISHAHQRGVIHRDLKPDNVLVDGQGAPHILDFGIARSLDPGAEHQTMEGDVVGTLAYMSPEQVSGRVDEIDVRTDVYALGVLLFRLLTGEAPIDFQGLSLAGVAQKLTTETARPAGQFDRSLRGDLETILATALASDRERRYASVDALRADVLAFLEQRPIAVRPPTALYHLTQFARRHKALVAASALSVLLLIAAVIGTSFGLQRAKSATALAQTERDRFQASFAFINRIFASADPAENGRGTLLVDVLQSAAFDLEADQTLTEPVRGTLHLTLGETFYAIDEWEQAQVHLEQAYRLLQRTDGEGAPITLRARKAWIRALQDGGRLDLARSETDALITWVQQNFEAASEPITPETVERHLLVRQMRAHQAWADQDWVLAESLFQEVMEGYAAVLPPGDALLDHATLDYVVALLALEKTAEAEPLVRAQLASKLERLPAIHPEVFTAKVHLASILSGQARYEEALEIYTELIPLASKLWGPDHSNTLTIRSNRTTELMQLERYEEAWPELQEVLDDSLRELGPTHVQVLGRMGNAAVAAIQLEKYEEAEQYFAAILEAYDQSNPDSDPYLWLLTLSNRAFAFEAQGKMEEALAAAQAAYDGQVQVLGAASIQAFISQNNLAMLRMKNGRAEEGLATIDALFATAQEHEFDHPYLVFPFQMNRGRCLAALGRFEEAEAELLAVQAALAADEHSPAHAKARIAEVLAETYDAWGKPEQAALWRIQSE